MSEPIGVGDWVEAVRDDQAGSARIVCGVPYRIKGIGPEGTCEICNDHGPGLYVDGVPLPYGWIWCHCVFRPIGGDPRSITLTQLLEDPADPEQVTA